MIAEVNVVGIGTIVTGAEVHVHPHADLKVHRGHEVADHPRGLQVGVGDLDDHLAIATILPVLVEEIESVNIRTVNAVNPDKLHSQICNLLHYSRK